MERYLNGDVVIIPFPYSNMLKQKRRPALILADLRGEDVILCQITSRLRQSRYCVSLDTHDFLHGTLPLPSIIHCSMVFTLSKGLIIKKVGSINLATRLRVLQTVGRLLSIEIQDYDDSS